MFLKATGKTLSCASSMLCVPWPAVVRMFGFSGGHFILDVILSCGFKTSGFLLVANWVLISGLVFVGLILHSSVTLALSGS